MNNRRVLAVLMSMWLIFALLVHCILQGSLAPAVSASPLFAQAEKDLSSKIAPKVFIFDMVCPRTLV
jgi:hypothetical protein